MLLGARLGMSGGGAAPLPYDAEVEYLESTGTQYIDTGIVQSFLPRYVVEAQSKASGDRKMIGAQGAYTWASAIGQYGDTWRLGATGSWRQVGSRTVQTIIDFDLKTGNYSLSTGESGTLRDGYKTGNNIYIFATSMANDGVSTKFVGKIWFVKVYDESNALVFDLVPVRRVENGVSVGYMYDRVSGELFGNSGTGAFILGPDK